MLVLEVRDGSSERIQLQTTTDNSNDSERVTRKDVMAGKGGEEWGDTSLVSEKDNTFVCCGGIRVYIVNI